MTSETEALTSQAVAEVLDTNSQTGMGPSLWRKMTDAAN
jgi:hypothetical protein